jgi:hypothetical protein
MGVRNWNIGHSRKCGCEVFGSIQQQLEIVQNDPLPAELIERTIAYAESKTAYIMALRQAMPQLINVAKTLGGSRSTTLPRRSR